MEGFDSCDRPSNLTEIGFKSSYPRTTKLLGGILVSFRPSVNIFEKIILDAKTKHLSPKSVRFKKYKHKISPWINNDILRSIRERDDLHKTLVSTASDAPNHDMLKHDLQNLKATLKKKIRCAKAKYYVDIFDKNKSNIRHTWAAIKEILGKFKNKHDFPDYFTLDGKMISDPCDSK